MTQTAGVTHGQTTVTNKQTELDEVRKKIEEIEYKITKLSINEAKKFAQNDLNMKSKKVGQILERCGASADCRSLYLATKKAPWFLVHVKNFVQRRFGGYRD